MPYVSVITAVYNGEKFIADAVNSILNQSFTDFEFIIINDGSTDETPDILDGFDDQRISIISQENKGLTVSLNTGIEYSGGTFIARMDGDDISHPERLERQVKFFRDNPDIGLLGTRQAFIDVENHIVGTLPIQTNDAEIRKKMRFGNIIPHGSVMFPRKSIEKVGLYREVFTCSQDYDLWLRISEHYRLANLGDILYFWRLNPDGITYKKHVRLINEGKVIRELADQRQLTGSDNFSKKQSDIITYLESLTMNEKWKRHSIMDNHIKRGFAAWYVKKFAVAREHLSKAVFRKGVGLLPHIIYLLSLPGIGPMESTDLVYNELIRDYFKRSVKNPNQ